MITEKYLDGMNFVLNLDIDKYSAIVAVGGDGTIHEVVNGILRRTDKKKLPLAILPNGSGNDCCGAI
jgi:sphingosine kinase